MAPPAGEVAFAGTEGREDFGYASGNLGLSTATNAPSPSVQQHKAAATATQVAKSRPLVAAASARGLARVLAPAAPAMEGEEIGLVLARASDLRSKIFACAAAAGARPPPPPRLGAGEEEDGGVEEDEDEEEVEVESLVGINDALESLERQLASLQDLQHQQRYERETILSQIDRSRRFLLNKLKEYKGQDCEIIHEAAAFAGEKIEHDDGLILPPYSSHITNSFVLDDLYPTNYMSKSKCLHNRLDSDGRAQADTRMNVMENRNASTSNHNSRRGIGSFIGWMAKTAVMVIGAISIMKAAGYDPMIGRNGMNFEIAGLFGKEATSAKEQAALQCPPGKVMVLQDGRAHCVVKERVEIPFSTKLASPNASYGVG